MQRRTFLGGVAIASLPVAAVAIPAPEAPEEHRDRLIGELAALLAQQTGRKIDVYRSKRDSSVSFCMG